MKSIAMGDRTKVQKYFWDPLVGIVVGGLLLFLKLLPTRLARALGSGLGGLAGLFAHRRSQIALFNLHIAFPNMPLKKRQEIVRQMWRHFGRVFAETLHLKRVMRDAQFEGLEYLQKAYRKGRGGFVCSAHLGNWEIPLGQQVAPDFYLNPVFRTANNPWLNFLLFSKRQGTHIPKGPAGARLMLSLLHQGKFIAILCDQKFREGMAIPLFGMPAQPPTPMAGLALKFKLPILMARCIYQKNGQYKVQILAPLTLPKNLSREQAEYQIMCRVNQIYEQWITENPEQWLWIHRRFHKSIYKKAGIG